MRIGPASFDFGTGRLVALGDVRMDGPVLDVFRAPTENDSGREGRNDVATLWRCTGLDRTIDRVHAIEVTDDGLSVAGRRAPAGQAVGLAWSFMWRSLGDGVRLDTVVEFVGPWHDTPLPRLGLRWVLPGDLRRVTWFGRGPGEAYADSRSAARVGRYTADVLDLQTPYAVPQENGNRVETRWLELSSPSGGRLRVHGMPWFDFTVRPWTSEALARARRPHELQDDGRTLLNVDHLQHGIGSASCGPALPARYSIPHETTSWSIVLRP